MMMRSLGMRLQSRSRTMATVRPWATWSGQSLCLEGVELGLVDGSGVQQCFGVGDLGARGGRLARDLLDVLLLGGPLLGRCGHLSIGHALASSDQVDDRTEPGQKDQHE